MGIEGTLLLSCQAQWIGPMQSWKHRLPGTHPQIQNPHLSEDLLGSCRNLGSSHTLNWGVPRAWVSLSQGFHGKARLWTSETQEALTDPHEALCPASEQSTDGICFTFQSPHFPGCKPHRPGAGGDPHFKQEWFGSPPLWLPALSAQLSQALR